MAINLVGDDENCSGVSLKQDQRTPSYIVYESPDQNSVLHAASLCRLCGLTSNIKDSFVYEIPEIALGYLEVPHAALISPGVEALRQTVSALLTNFTYSLFTIGGVVHFKGSRDEMIQIYLALLDLKPQVDDECSL